MAPRRPTDCEDERTCGSASSVRSPMQNTPSHAAVSMFRPPGRSHSQPIAAKIRTGGTASWLQPRIFAAKSPHLAHADWDVRFGFGNAAFPRAADCSVAVYPGFGFHGARLRVHSTRGQAPTRRLATPPALSWVLPLSSRSALLVRSARKYPPASSGIHRTGVRKRGSDCTR